jgi:hypothetical protein
MTYLDDPFAVSTPGLSFADAEPGHSYTGTVVGAPELVQQRDYTTGDPATWPDGNPKMAVVITLDVAGEMRSLWCPKPSAMFQAVGDAQRRAGARIADGGTLTVTFTGTVPSKKGARYNPQKLYSATYRSPNGGGGADPFADAPAKAPETAAARPQPTRRVSQPADDDIPF